MSVKQQSTSLPCSVFQRAFKAGSSWPDKEEFLDVIYWMRQVLGLVFGLIWGIAAFQGALALVGFAVINAAIIYLYFSAFQAIDEDEYGGAWELTKEGFMTSFASFMVTWIIFYAGLHFD